MYESIKKKIARAKHLLFMGIGLFDPFKNVHFFDLLTVTDYDYEKY